MLNQGGSESSALGGGQASKNQDLASLIEAWPTLLDAFKAGILTVVRGRRVIPVSAPIQASISEQLLRVLRRGSSVCRSIVSSSFAAYGAGYLAEQAK